MSYQPPDKRSKTERLAHELFEISLAGCVIVIMGCATSIAIAFAVGIWRWALGAST